MEKKKSMATEWLAANRERIYCDDDMSIAIPKQFLDGSTICLHENGISLISDVTSTKNENFLKVMSHLRQLQFWRKPILSPSGGDQ